MLLATAVAAVTLLKVQEKDSAAHAAASDVDPFLMNRHWYVCVGPQFPEATAEEVALGIKAANNVCCSREMTFQELCCMDFPNMQQYWTPNNAAPYHGATCPVLNTDAAQIPAGLPGAMIDDVAAFPNAKVAVICTGQVAAGDIAAQQGGGPAVLTGQLCTTEEFPVADITATSGAVVLDKRIEFLMKQGLPGSAIPVCHAQVASCPAASAKCQAEGAAGGCAPNSASDAVLQGVGQGRPLALVERAEDEMAALPENQVSAGVARRQRSYVKTLGMLAKMSEADLRAELGESMRFTIVTGAAKEIVRLNVKHVTAGDHVVLAGESSGKAARIEVANSKAELVTDAGREALDLDDVVLSSLGRSYSLDAAFRRGGAVHFSPSFTVMSANTAGNSL